MKTTILGEESLERAQAMVRAIESGDEGQAISELNGLMQVQDSELFQKLGRLTRGLHDSLAAFAMDDRVSELATHEVPDARQRLSYVVEMTEQAAHRTIGAVEAALPVSDSIQQNGQAFAERWDAMPAEQKSSVNGMDRELVEFIDTTVASARDINTNLTEVLMAQEYQDLSGQVIRKVITLVKDVEENLVDLVCLAGGATEPADRKLKTTDEQGHGPVVPGVDERADAVASQDDVDDLLSSLGF